MRKTVASAAKVCYDIITKKGGAPPKGVKKKLEEKKNYAQIALFGLRNKLSGFATAVYGVKTDDMADKETRAFWQGARYAADACIRACCDAEGWAEMSEEYDNDEAGDAEVEVND